MKDPEIVVLLSTFNGVEVLPRVLAGYERIVAPSCKWHMVVIDNASTDRTREVLAAFEERLPLSVLEEPTPGKNRALNRGLDYLSLNFDFLVITDDDAIPERDFLIEWESTMRSQLDAEIFGASVVPVFDSPPPAWLMKHEQLFRALYAKNLRNEGYTSADNVFGPNMAVRRSIFSKGYRFFEGIGPDSSQQSYPMGSESEFCDRVAREAMAIVYFASGPKVTHIVRAKQLTRQFVVGRAYRSGRGTAKIELQSGVARSRAGIAFRARQVSRALKGALGNTAALYDFHWARGYQEVLRS